MTNKTQPSSDSGLGDAFEAGMTYLSQVTGTTKAILHSYPHAGFISGLIEAIRPYLRTQPAPQVADESRAGLTLHTATKAFCDALALFNAHGGKGYEEAGAVIAAAFHPTDEAAHADMLAKAIGDCIEANLHLVDGDVCTLSELKKALTIHEQRRTT